MRPVRLELCHFGPYLGRHVIDFEALGRHGLFLIHGPTGAGKSSILDALCFALFGEASGEDRKGRDLATTLQQDERTTVTLEFEHLGRSYRISRCPPQEVAKQRGEGTTTRQPEVTFEDLDEGAVIATKIREANEAVEGLLCCNAGQFRQTVVLPQGAFRKVITDDDERRNILARIFDTERFAAFTDRLKRMAGELENESRHMLEKRQALFDDAEAQNEEELRKRIDGAAARVGELGAARQRAAALRDARFSAKTTAQTLLEQFERADALRLERARLEERGSEMATLRERLERGRRAAALKDFRRSLDEARSDRAELQEALARVQEGLARAREELAEAEEAFGFEQSPARQDERQAAEAEAGRLGALEAQVGRLAGMQARRRKLQEAVRLAESALEERRREAKEIEARRDVLLERNGEIAILLQSEAGILERKHELDQEVRALREIAGLREEATRLAGQIDELIAQGDPSRHLESTVREHAPGLLAASLEGGEPCPVCGSPHHPAPAHEAAGIDRLQEAFERYGEARARQSRLEEKRSASEGRIEEIARDRGWDADGLPALEESERALAETRSRLAELERLKVEATALAAQVESAKAELASAVAAVEAAEGERERARVELGGIEGSLDQLLSQLDPQHHDPDAFRAALDAARRRHGGLQAAFKGANDRLLQAKGKADTEARAVETLQGRLETAGEKLERLEEEFVARLEEQGFADMRDLDDATLGSRELNGLEREVSGFDEALRRTREGLEQLGEQLAGRDRPDIAALGAALDEAQEAFDAADQEWHEARALQERLETVEKQLAELEGKHGRLKKRIEAAKKLANLAAGKLKGHARVDFETFVLQSIFHQVLSVGNRHLKHMTAGRYSIHLRLSEAASARGLELDVSDHYNGGQRRPVHTLSGGEGFLASLALALGLSEIAQRTSGGSELGALFIDEGFGSLDPHSLDQAVRILRDLPQYQRMVGVISHVEELKRRIPVQLLVVRQKQGSRVELKLNA